MSLKIQAVKASGAHIDFQVSDPTAGEASAQGTGHGEVRHRRSRIESSSLCE